MYNFIKEKFNLNFSDEPTMDEKASGVRQVELVLMQLDINNKLFKSYHKEFF